uniref:hypothetical protein n=1 Tax=Natronospira sp. TaxID=2024970 RepID=UPI00387376AE
VEDFRVTIGGRPARLEAVEWIPGDEPFPEGLPPAEAEVAGVPPTPPGRLVVLFFQTDYVRERMTGLYRMVPRARDLVAGLRPHDRVAVVTFDAHLKLHLDFTADREALDAVLRPTVLFRSVEPLPDGEFPSLAAHFPFQEAQRAASPEAALRITAEALREIPGPKTLVFFGWGFGRFDRSGVRLGPDYHDARAALVRARVTVLSLDVTDADYHSLEVAMEQLAYDTGGFYVKTHQFPGQAVERVALALTGRYVLVVERPEQLRSRRNVRVELVGRSGTVMARRELAD